MSILAGLVALALAFAVQRIALEPVARRLRRHTETPNAD